MVSDCAEEVAVLRSMMKSDVRRRLDGVDRGKLSYLVFLMNTDNGAFLKQKAELLRRLQNRDGQGG